MRFLKFTGLAALVLASAACQQDDGGVKVTSVPPLAYVRYVNAVPDSLVPAIVSIRINAVTTLPETTFTTTNYTSTLRFTDYLEFTPQSWANVGFRGLGLGGYQGVKAGSRTFKIFTFDPTFFTTSQRADTTFNFVAGNYYTIVHWQDGSAAQQVRILSETLPAVNATNFQYKVTNLAQGVGALDGYQTADSTTAIAGATTVAGIAELGSSAYVSSALAATMAVQVTNAGTTTRVAGPRAPAGGASASGLEYFAGSNQGGSVMTAFAYRGQPAVTAFNRSWRAAQAPTVVWWMDRRPGIMP